MADTWPTMSNTNTDPRVFFGTVYSGDLKKQLDGLVHSDSALLWLRQFGLSGHSIGPGDIRNDVDTWWTLGDFAKFYDCPAERQASRAFVNECLARGVANGVRFPNFAEVSANLQRFISTEKNKANFIGLAKSDKSQWSLVDHVISYVLKMLEYRSHMDVENMRPKSDFQLRQRIYAQSFGKFRQFFRRWDRSDKWAAACLLYLRVFMQYEDWVAANKDKQPGGKRPGEDLTSDKTKQTKTNDATPGPVQNTAAQEAAQKAAQEKLAAQKAEEKQQKQQKQAQEAATTKPPGGSSYQPPIVQDAEEPKGGASPPHAHAPKDPSPLHNVVEPDSDKKTAAKGEKNDGEASKSKSTTSKPDASTPTPGGPTTSQPATSTATPSKPPTTTPSTISKPTTTKSPFGDAPSGTQGKLNTSTSDVLFGKYPGLGNNPPEPPHQPHSVFLGSGPLTSVGILPEDPTEGGLYNNPPGPYPGTITAPPGTLHLPHYGIYAAGSFTPPAATGAVPAGTVPGSGHTSATPLAAPAGWPSGTAAAPASSTPAVSVPAPSTGAPTPGAFWGSTTPSTGIFGGHSSTNPWATGGSGSTASAPPFTMTGGSGPAPSPESTSWGGLGNSSAAAPAAAPVASTPAPSTGAPAPAPVGLFGGSSTSYTPGSAPAAAPVANTPAPVSTPAVSYPDLSGVAPAPVVGTFGTPITSSTPVTAPVTAPVAAPAIAPVASTPAPPATPAVTYPNLSGVAPMIPGTFIPAPPAPAAAVKPQSPHPNDTTFGAAMSEEEPVAPRRRIRFWPFS
ncbi:hypothetical protein GGR53DRAFT_468961 [Hypoxylon sp. FL1150]|nr:hypothetical protein GGR53DRAFT_468961 [Hypoxylon sp. FL1150]